jgi:hypothetical protein
MARKSGTGLTQHQADRLAAQLAPFRERYSSDTAMAKAWTIAQSQMSGLLKASYRGAGISVLCRIRTHTGISIDDLLGLPPLGRTLDRQIEDKIRAALIQFADGASPRKDERRQNAQKRPEKGT